MGFEEFGLPRFPWKEEHAGSNPASHTNSEENMKIDLKKIFKEIYDLTQEGFHGKVILSFNNGKITNLREEKSLDLEKFKADDASK